MKKQHKQDKKRKLELTETEQGTKKGKEPKSDLMNAYEEEKTKYSHLQKELPKKGKSREQFTLDLLAKFKSKLYDAKDKVKSSGDDEPVAESSSANKDDDGELADENWLGHELHFESQTPVLAKDAATKEDDWYDVYDPRNPLNKRRREASKHGKKN